MKGIIRPKYKGRLDPTQVWRRLLPWRYVSNRLFELPFSQPQRMWGTEYKAQSSLSIESLLGDPPPSLETTEVYTVHERLKQKYTLPCQSFSTPWESPSVVSDCLRPLGLYSPWNSSGQNIRVGSIPFSFPPFPFPGDLPNPRIEPRSPTLQVDSLSAEPPGKPIREPSGKHSMKTWIKSQSALSRAGVVNKS